MQQICRNLRFIGSSGLRQKFKPRIRLVAEPHMHRVFPLIHSHDSARMAKKARRMPEGRAGAKYGGRNTGKHLGGFLLGNSSVQAKKRIAFRPFRLCNLAVAQLRKRADRHADFISDLRLRKAVRLDLGNDFVPVHSNLFSISRNSTLRQVEMQVKDN